jgi:molybdopterin-guanine dinucleotide biosynthesis protein A
MKVSAVLLAGGQSLRMGKDKATLTFRGKPLWQVQLNTFQNLRPDEIFISARSDPSWRPAELQFVPDEPPSRGPLSGVAAALGHIATGHLLVLAIDMPLMTAEYLRSLCDQIESERGVLPLIDGRAEPLAAIYPKSGHIDFLTALSGTEFSLQSVTKKLTGSGKLRPIPVIKKHEELFRSFNQPADFNPTVGQKRNRTLRPTY